VVVVHGGEENDVNEKDGFEKRERGNM